MANVKRMPCCVMQHHESALNTVRNNEDCKAGDGEEISGEIYYT